MAVIEAARNLAGIKNATSTEFGACDNPLVGLMTEWKTEAGAIETRSEGGDMGGTMRLGAYACVLLPKTRVRAIYGRDLSY